MSLRSVRTKRSVIAYLLLIDDLWSWTPARLADKPSEWACISGKLVPSQWRVGGRLICFFLPPVHTWLHASALHKFGNFKSGRGDTHYRCRPDEHDGELRQQAAERRRLPPDLQRQKKWLRKESLLVPRAAEVSPPEGEGEAHPSNGDESEGGDRGRTPPVACSRSLVAWFRKQLERNDRGTTVPLRFNCDCQLWRAANVLVLQLKYVTFTNMAGK